MVAALQIEPEPEGKSLVDELREVVREEMAAIADRQRLQSYRKHLTPEELAVYLGVEPSWVYEHTRPGATDRIPHYKLGKYVRFDLDDEDFKAWLRSHKQTVTIDSKKPAP